MRNGQTTTTTFEQFTLIATLTNTAGQYRLTAQNIITGRFDSLIVFGELPETSKQLIREFGDIISVGICYCNQTFQEYCEYLYLDLETEAADAIESYEKTAEKTRLAFNIIGSYGQIKELSEQIEFLNS